MKIALMTLGLSMSFTGYFLGDQAFALEMPQTASLNACHDAEELAKSLPRVKKNMATLRNEAKKIKDPKLKSDALQLLDRPNYSVLEGRRAQEAEILKQLKTEKLIDDSTLILFPAEQAMSFIAAPAGPWNGHHRYPGGLVDHTLTNLKIGLGVADTYHNVQGVRLNADLIRAAAIWHDSAKTFTVHWEADGRISPSEAKIAGTAAHHVWAIAEALYRGYPVKFILTLAAAHSSAFPGNDLQVLLNYLRAGAIIAGVPYSVAGLKDDGKGLDLLPPIESFVNHIDDHDYVLSSPAAERTAIFIDQILGHAEPNKNYWDRDRILAQWGDLEIYQRLASHGERKTAEWLRITGSTKTK